MANVHENMASALQQASDEIVNIWESTEMPFYKPFQNTMLLLLLLLPLQVAVVAKLKVVEEETTSKHDEGAGHEKVIMGASNRTKRAHTNSIIRKHKQNINNHILAWIQLYKQKE